MDQIETRLSELAQSRDAANARLGAIGQQLKADETERGRRAALLRELDEVRKTYDVWDAINQAIGSSDGSKFRTFALRYTFEALLALANEQLRALAPRYRLERAPGGDLSLLIVDQDMAGEARGPRSLSGGERFLIALALALALSTLGAGRAVIETLFIDEGFGALDSESLDRAMEGLEALQTQGRTVGVITHVEAMKERIPVQIIITRQGGGRSCVATASV